jgi:O-antigen ligase
MTRRLFYLMLLTIPAGRLLSASLFESATKVASLTLDQFVLCTLIFLYFYPHLLHARLPFKPAHRARPILLFSAWCLISLMLNKFRYGLTIGQTGFSALYLGRWISYSLLYFIAYDICKTGDEVKRIVRWLVIGGGLFCAFGLLQAVFLPDFALMLHPDAVPLVDFDPQGHRLVSTFLDPNIAAGYILIFTLLALSFWIHGYSKWLGILLLLGGALFATLSRGGVLGFFVGVALLLSMKKFPRRRALMGVLALLLLVFVMYPSLRTQIEDAQRISIDDASALSRIEEWKLSLDIISSNPVVGIGFNTLGFIAPRYGIIRESASAFGLAGDLLTILALTGAIGLILYLRIGGEIFNGLSRLRDVTKSTWVRAYARGVQASTIAVLVSSSFTTLLLYPQIMAVLWVLWALGRRLQEGIDADMQHANA